MCSCKEIRSEGVRLFANAFASWRGNYQRTINTRIASFGRLDYTGNETHY